MFALRGTQSMTVFRLLIELQDPGAGMSPDEVMHFYSATYPELTTSSVHGPNIEKDCATYEFKTTVGTKG